MKKTFLLLIGAIVLLSLQSCAFTLLDWATPSSGYTVQKNIAYGDHKRQKLDVYSPTKPKANAPTLVFFYGGAWDSGSKDDYRFVAQAFAEQGYPVIIPDYRLYPEIKFPDFLDDAAQSVKWSSDNTQSPIVIMGHSAGAHIAAMLVLDEQYLDRIDMDRERLKAWIGLSGPYDFLPFTSRKVKSIFSSADNTDQTQPIHFADKKSIPTLLIHGLNDKRVLPRNSKNLAKVLKANETAVREHYYEDTSHAMTVGSISVRFREQTPSFDDILKFLDE